MAEIVFYKEQKEVVVQVVEFEETYKIISVIPTRDPSRIETQYEYSDFFKKGTLWNSEKLMLHGFLEFEGQIKSISEKRGDI